MDGGLNICVADSARSRGCQPLGVVGRVDGGRRVGSQRVGLEIHERSALHVPSLDGSPLSCSHREVKLVGDANEGRGRGQGRDNSAAVCVVRVDHDLGGI